MFNFGFRLRLPSRHYIPGLSDKLSHPFFLFFFFTHQLLRTGSTYQCQPLHAMGMHWHQRRFNDDASSSSAVVAHPAAAATSAQPQHDGQQRNGNTRGGSVLQLDTQQLDTIIICKLPFFFLFLYFSFSLLGSVCSKAVARQAANAMAAQ